MNRLATALLLGAALVVLVGAFLLRPRIGHPVTPWMRDAATASTGRTVPSLPEINRGRPAIVVFIRPDCPCSEAYEPATHELFSAYGAQADFVGVVAGDLQAARNWQRTHHTPYPVLPDPDRSLARAYGAERSAYTALVTDGKTVAHLWPGYSVEMLQDLGARVATSTGTKAVPLTLPQVPIALTSGCRLD